MAGANINFAVNQANVVDYLSKSGAYLQHVRGPTAFHQGIFENLSNIKNDGDDIDYKNEFVGRVLLMLNPPVDNPNPGTALKNVQIYALKNGFVCKCKLTNVPVQLYAPGIWIEDYISVLTTVTDSFNTSIQPTTFQYASCWITSSAQILKSVIDDEFYITFSAQYVEPIMQDGWIPDAVPTGITLKYRLIRNEYNVIDEDPNPPPGLRKKY